MCGSEGRDSSLEKTKVKGEKERRRDRVVSGPEESLDGQLLGSGGRPGSRAERGLCGRASRLHVPPGADPLASPGHSELASIWGMSCICP